jgi:hypothetical protein
MWTLARKMRNKLAHSWHGNKSKSWKQKHKADAHVKISVGTLNPSGLSDVTKLQALHELDLDVLGIAKTHLGNHMHRAFAEQYSQYPCSFSLDPKEKLILVLHFY